MGQRPSSTVTVAQLVPPFNKPFAWEVSKWKAEDADTKKTCWHPQSRPGQRCSGWMAGWVKGLRSREVPPTHARGRPDSAALLAGVRAPERRVTRVRNSAGD